MKIALLGATGHLGGRVLAEALGRGHGVTALVRNPAKLTVRHERLRVVTGDALEAGAAGEAVRGQEAVVSALGGGLQGPFEVLTDGLRTVLGAMREADVSRVVAVAAAGVLQHDARTLRRDQPGFPAMFREVSAAHLESFRILEDSGLEWTLLCPPQLPPGERTGRYRLLADYFPEGGRQVSLEDAAKAILDELEQPRFVGRRLGIAY